MTHKNQTKKTSARNWRSFRRSETIVRQLRPINLHAFCGIDSNALAVLKNVAKPSTLLFTMVYNALLGFDATVQAYAAEAVSLYYSGHARTYTCLPSVDAMLEQLYQKIDKILDEGE